jgi:hypothetical protein
MKTLIMSLLFLLLVIPTEAQTSPQHLRDTKTLLPAVAQAIEDELYDLRHEKLYFQIDDNSGGNNSPAQISFYVSKTLSANGTGVVLYKDMPYGEVYRYFVVEESGLVKLSGNPTSGFPPTGGSMLTIYMTDEQVCDFIQNRSYKSKFTIDPDASRERIREAENRQIRRTGYSFRLSEKTGQKK